MNCLRREWLPAHCSTGSTFSTAAAPVGIGLGVFMTAKAVGLLGLPVRAMANPVVHVLRWRSILKIAKPVVRPYAIEVSGDQAAGLGAAKGLQHKLMNSSHSVGASAGYGHDEISLPADLRTQNASLHDAGVLAVPIQLGNGSVFGSDSSQVRNRVVTLETHCGQPFFKFGHSSNYIRRGI